MILQKLKPFQIKLPDGRWISPRDFPVSQSVNCYTNNQLKNTTMSTIARIGKPAPQWTATAVVGSDFKDISLSDYKGKYVVLVFYPLGSSQFLQFF